MAELSRQDEPPNPGPEYPLLRIKATTPIRYVILSRKMYGLWTHWMGEFSMPCTSVSGVCEGCKLNKQRRWKGYVHALNMQTPEEGFLELTPGGAKQLISQVGKGQELRGVQVKLQRGNGQKSRLRVEVVYALPSSAGMELPEEKSPEITLFALWSKKGFRLRRPEDDDLDSLPVAS